MKLIINSKIILLIIFIDLRLILTYSSILLYMYNFSEFSTKTYSSF
jgi:hypothetical protein